MYEAPYITAEEEEALLQEWFETVHFDEESEGIPELEPERDDEERSLVPIKSPLETVDMDTLLEELRKRDPDNPF